ncbi:MAG: hypothetical protein RLZZ546_1805 [Bacteroidota bacterium]
MSNFVTRLKILIIIFIITGLFSNIIYGFHFNSLVSKNFVYKIADSETFCNENTFCQAINVVQQVDDIIGYNFTINFDPIKIMPTGTVIISNDLVNSSYVEVYSNINMSNGTMNIFLFFNGSAPSTAEFSGIGNLCCIEFTKKAAFTCNTSTIFTIPNMEESYISGIVNEPVQPGSHTNLNALPIVSIESPITNALYNCSNSITIEVSATDVDGTISLVEFYLDGIKIGEDNFFPYSQVANNLSAGYRNLKVKAFDNLGGMKFSNAVIIYINNPPITSITSPINNAIYYKPSVLSIISSAIDIDSGEVVLVEFFRDNIKIGEDNTFPYTLNLSNPPIGTYNLTAKAMDEFGAMSISSVSTIQVKCYREDLNDNGVVNTSDLLLLLSLFGTNCSGCRADFNDDGLINSAELLSFLAKFGLSCN